MAFNRPSQATLRLMSDLKEITQDPPEGVSGSPVNEENMMVWNASIMGPDDTPWEGGIYTMRLVFTEEYPERPPRDVRFLVDMYHPNIFSDGSLCLDIIQERWSPTYTASSLLSSIQSLLTDPNCTSPANPEAARMYQSNLREYNKKVRRCAARSVEM